MLVGWTTCYILYRKVCHGSIISKDKDKDISKKQLYDSICNPNMQGVKEALKNHAELAKETIKISSKTKPLELAVREIESGNGHVK